MAKPVLLLSQLSVCLLVLFQGSLAHHCSQQQNQCQLDRLNALEPDSTVQCEAGTIESWNPNRAEFQCAGVAVVRRTIEPNGLLLPFYSNAPQLVYIVQGRGMTGTVFPACHKTFQESQESVGGTPKAQDQHQKIHRFRQGDVLALPAGVAHWCYNDGNDPIIAVSVIDTTNSANQLDRNPRNFHLAGNPVDEFQQSQSGREGQYSHGQGRRPLYSCNNLFCGMDTRLISESFNINEQLAKKLQSQDDFRGNIVNVEGGLRLVRPPMTQQEKFEQEERGQGGHCYNGLEETFCTLKIRENIADPSRADVYVPEVGRVSTVNSKNLPILRWLQLSASHVSLNNGAVRLPHWHINAHSIIYALRGVATIQVVNEFGNTVFDGSIREGQVLTVPQNFVVVKRAERGGFQYVAFQTNDNAMSSDLAGRTSAINGMPVEVLANAFRVSIEDARSIKSGRQETTLTMSTVKASV